MKSRTAILCTVFLFCTVVLSGCGKENPTKAAKESDVTEREGTSSAEDVQPEAEADALPEEEVVRETIGILLPSKSDDRRWMGDEDAFRDRLAGAGFDCLTLFADQDALLQSKQVLELSGEGVAAMIIAPVDVWALSDTLDAVRETEIPVISYNDLIMDTDVIKYLTTFDSRQMGHQAASEVMHKLTLGADVLPYMHRTYTAEFFMGAPGDFNDLFFFNGLMEELQPYFEDGTLTCPSQAMTYDMTAVPGEDPQEVLRRFETILDEYYRWNEMPDVIFTSDDSYAQALIEWLLEQERLPGGPLGWPLISGVGAQAEAVGYVAGGYMDMTIFMDNRRLAEAAADLVVTLLSGEDPEVSDYGQYDNGQRLIRAITVDTQTIDKDNYQILIDNRYYDYRELAPVLQTPVPSPEPETETETETTTQMPGQETA